MENIWGLPFPLQFLTQMKYARQSVRKSFLVLFLSFLWLQIIPCDTAFWIPNSNGLLGFRPRLSLILVSFREVVLRAFQTELRFHLKLNPMTELNKIFKLNHMFGPSVIHVRRTYACEYFVLWWRWRSVFSLRNYLLSFTFNELNISCSTWTSLNLFFQLKFFMAWKVASILHWSILV